MNIGETVLIVIGAIFAGALVMAVLGRLLSILSDGWAD